MNERAALTRTEAFTDTQPRLAENTHGQEQDNCGHFGVLTTSRLWLEFPLANTSMVCMFLAKPVE